MENNLRRSRKIKGLVKKEVWGEIEKVMVGFKAVEDEFEFYHVSSK